MAGQRRIPRGRGRSWLTYVGFGVIILACVKSVMVAGLFALGCLVIGFGLITILHNQVGIFPFAFPHLGDVTSVIAIGLALIGFAVVFRIPAKK